jgi:hypothetical protein
MPLPSVKDAWPRRQYAGGMQDQPPKAQLLALVRGHRLTDMVVVVVRLGIPDLLTKGAADASTIAAATGTHAPTLYRLLRALAAAGVFHEDEQGRFSLTANGAYLAADHPESLRAWVSVVDSAPMRQAWANLEHSIRTGENSFKALHGEDVWAWRRHEPEEAATFNRAMAAMSAGVGTAVAKAFDFGGRSLVADIGGGSGSLLAAILVEHPHLRGILFDQPAVVAEPVELERAGVGGRCEIVGGSFFDRVPGGGDAYILKSVVHDWDDEQSVRILEACRSAMDGDAVLLLMERLIAPPNLGADDKLSDLNMLVGPGGMERTIEEFDDLLGRGGFRLSQVIATGSAMRVIEAVPA